MDDGLPLFSSFQSNGMIARVHPLPLCANHGVFRIGEPTDMAGVAIFLASPASAWITGATIVLDGGMLVKAKM